MIAVQPIIGMYTNNDLVPMNMLKYGETYIAIKLSNRPVYTGKSVQIYNGKYLNTMIYTMNRTKFTRSTPIDVRKNGVVSSCSSSISKTSLRSAVSNSLPTSLKSLY